jgi:uncharacterized protein DUF4124
MRHIKALAVFAGVLSCSLIHTEMAQAGDVYKYVDERGTTLYTDKPIPGAVLVSTGSQRPPEVAARASAASQTATNAQLAASNQRIAEAQNDSRVSANVAKDVGASQAERCKEARAQYQTTITSRKLYKETGDGQRVYLNDAETDQARLDSAKKVEAICGPQG